MIELTLYGRGGQGGVTLAKLIATAFFLRGKWAQAFGVYAAERSGAPVQAYVRVDDQEIASHNQIREPDHVIVLDPTLVAPSVAAGLKPGGWIILNTPRAEPRLFAGYATASVDATSIAIQNGLGTAAVPIVNTTMLGAVARVLGLSLAEVRATLADLDFGGANVIAAEKAYHAVRLVPAEAAASALKAAAPPPYSRPASLFDDDIGGMPRIRTGSWATRRPERRTLTPPCNHACPAGNDVQRFLDAASRDEYDRALAVLLETTPLPGVCGRVCPAPCMAGCNRKAFDEGVNVRELERFVSDGAGRPEATRPWRREQIAVVGSGPAGLSASYHLARLGYPVTLLEAGDELGGVLRNGIPEYRLPKDVLDREIGYILDHGLTVFTGERVDQATLHRLTQKYAAVFVATGLQSSKAMDLGGRGDRVLQGIDFLDRVHDEAISLRDERVVVVGGGNTAIDAARSAVRLGARDVRILYRRTRAEMPAIAEEIDAAIEEGVELDELALPLHLDGDRLTCTRMGLGEPDESGRRRPVRSTGAEAELILGCDRVILALGQSADSSLLCDWAGLPVFTGGDFDRNEGTVAAAIGSGRRAAMDIHRAISGETLLPSEAPRVATPGDLHLGLFQHAWQQRGAAAAPELRKRNFLEVHEGLDERYAALEARRCLSCGVCNECDRCVQHCPEGILAHDGAGYRFDYDYCKGCGVCASECPRGAIAMAQL